MPMPGLHAAASGASGSEGPDQVLGKAKGKGKKAGKGRGRGANAANAATNQGDNIPKTKTALQEAKQVWGLITYMCVCVLVFEAL